jgi:hypothetical protein
MAIHRFTAGRPRDSDRISFARATNSGDGGRWTMRCAIEVLLFRRIISMLWALWRGERRPVKSRRRSQRIFEGPTIHFDQPARWTMDLLFDALQLFESCK